MNAREPRTPNGRAPGAMGVLGVPEEMLGTILWFVVPWHSKKAMQTDLVQIADCSEQREAVHTLFMCRAVCLLWHDAASDVQVQIAEQFLHFLYVLEGIGHVGGILHGGSLFKWDMRVQDEVMTASLKALVDIREKIETEEGPDEADWFLHGLETHLGDVFASLTRFRSSYSEYLWSSFEEYDELVTDFVDSTSSMIMALLDIEYSVYAEMNPLATVNRWHYRMVPFALDMLALIEQEFEQARPCAFFLGWHFDVLKRIWDFQMKRDFVETPLHVDMSGEDFDLRKLGALPQRMHPMYMQGLQLLMHGLVTLSDARVKNRFGDDGLDSYRDMADVICGVLEVFLDFKLSCRQLHRLWFEVAFKVGETKTECMAQIVLQHIPKRPLKTAGIDRSQFIHQAWLLLMAKSAEIDKQTLLEKRYFNNICIKFNRLGLWRTMHAMGFTRTQGFTVEPLIF